MPSDRPPTPTLETFDWSLTERRIVMLVPNFGRGHLFRAAFDSFRTRLPQAEYLVLVANDGIEEDFRDLGKRNVACLTLRPGETTARNGAKLRNSVLKRCRSEWVFQRDPEIMFGDDVLGRCVSCERSAYRVGQVALLDRATTDLIRRGVDAAYPMPVASRRIVVDDAGAAACESCDGVAVASPPPLIDTLSWRPIDSNASTFLHFGFGVRTSLLQSIRGYDEAFTHYGYEDVDLFERLREIGELPVTDFEVRAAPLWHEPQAVGRVSVKNDAIAMRRVYLEHRAMGPVRNSETWGEG